jgi:DNA-binding transcriptional LysR family regulator
MNWHGFDLNLLVVFDAVAHERSLTRAGRRLGISQPAVSHALARLRVMLKDELFVRTPEGMLPTARAERMAGPARNALRDLRVTLESPEFDASRSSRRFTIAANTYAAHAVIPAFARRLAIQAPSVVLEVRPIGTQHVLDHLDDGGVELALNTLTEGGDRFKCVGLLDDDYVAVLSGDNPASVEPALSIERFAALPHIGVSSGCDMRFIGEALAGRGLARVVSATVPLNSLIMMLIGSGALAVIPRRVAADVTAVLPLIMRPLPFASSRVELSMIWHRRLDNDPAQRWLRGTLRAAVNENSYSGRRPSRHGSGRAAPGARVSLERSISPIVPI